MTRLFGSWDQAAVSIFLVGLFVGSCTLLWNCPLAAKNKYMEEMGVSVGETSVPSGEDVSPSGEGVDASGEYVAP